MKKREPVAHIMTQNVIAVQEQDSLEDVVAVFKKNHIRHLPVMQGNKVSGIISSTDINRLTFGALFDGQEGADEAVLQMLSVPQVMTSHPKTIPSDMTIKEVAEMFSESDFHAVPVVDGGELKGIVTTTDVIRYMLEQY